MPLPRIDEILNQIQEATVYTSLDIMEAYYRLRIKKGKEWKTAFRTRYELYEWLVMLIGLINAPVIFQRFITHILRHLLNKKVVMYLDDILIYSKTLEEY